MLFTRRIAHTSDDLPFIRGFAWNHSAKLAEYVLSYVFMVMVARALGPSLNGTYATLLAVSQLLIALSSAGIDVALNRFLPQLSGETAAGNISYLVRRLILLKLALLALLSVILGFGWNEIQHWFRLESAANQFLFFIITFGIIRSLSASLSAIWLSQLDPKPILIINTSTLVLQIAAVAVSIHSGLALNGVLFIVVAGSAVSLIANLVAGRKFYLTPSSPVPLRPAVSFSGWLWLNALMEFFQGKQGDVAMLSLLAVDASSIGRYDVAYGLSQLPAFLVAGGFAGISISMFAKLANNQRDVAQFWGRLSRLITHVTIPVYCFVFVFAGDILGGLFSDDYLGASTFLQVLIAGRMVTRLFGGGENTDALLSMKQERTVVAFSIGFGSLNIVLNLLLIPKFGALGAAYATGSATILVNAATWSFLRKRIHVPMLAGTWLPTVLIGFVPVMLMKFFLPSPSVTQLAFGGIVCLFVWTVAIIALRRNEAGNIHGATTETAHRSDLA